MAYNLFQRRAKGDAAPSEFAATVQSLPADAESKPAAEVPSTGPAALDLDTGASSPPSDLGADSLPAPEADIELQPTIRCTADGDKTKVNLGRKIAVQIKLAGKSTMAQRER